MIQTSAARPPRPVSLPAIPRPRINISGNVVQQKRSYITSVSISDRNKSLIDSPDFSNNNNNYQKSLSPNSRNKNVSSVSTTIHPKSPLASSIPVPVSKRQGNSFGKPANLLSKPPQYSRLPSPSTRNNQVSSPFQSLVTENKNKNEIPKEILHEQSDHSLTRSSSLPPFHRQYPRTEILKQKLKRSLSSSPPLKSITSPSHSLEKGNENDPVKFATSRFLQISSKPKKVR